MSLWMLWHEVNGLSRYGVQHKSNWEWHWFVDYTVCRPRGTFTTKLTVLAHCLHTVIYLVNLRVNLERNCITEQLVIIFFPPRTYGAPPVNLNIKTAGSRPYGQGIGPFFFLSFSSVLNWKAAFLLSVLICAAFFINSKAEGSGSGCSWEHKWGSGAGSGNGVLWRETLEEARFVFVWLIHCQNV